jgi:hypothetical protein
MLLAAFLDDHGTYEGWHIHPVDSRVFQCLPRNANPPELVFTSGSSFALLNK